MTCKETPPSPETLDKARIVQRHVRRLRNFMLSGPPPRAQSYHWQGRRLSDPTFPQIRSMLVLSTLGPTTLKDFAANLNISPGSASEMVERLVEGGWVTREQDPGDRRRVVIKLTPAAASLADAHENAVLGQLARIMQAMEPAYVDQWLDLAQYMAGVLDGIDGDPEADDDRQARHGTGVPSDL